MAKSRLSVVQKYSAMSVALFVTGDLIIFVFDYLSMHLCITCLKTAA